MLVIAFLLSCTFTSLLGYWIHRLFHRRISGKAYKAHLNHHLQQYLSKSFLSEEYRDAGTDSTARLFWIAAIPIVGTIVGLFLLKIVSPLFVIIVCAGIASVGFLHDYFHDQIHISPCYWERFAFFRNMREQHRIHHSFLNKNFGILFFTWDHLFRTFKESKQSK